MPGPGHLRHLSRRMLAPNMWPSLFRDRLHLSVSGGAGPPVFHMDKVVGTPIAYVVRKMEIASWMAATDNAPADTIRMLERVW